MVTLVPGGLTGNFFLQVHESLSLHLQDEALSLVRGLYKMTLSIAWE